MWLPPSVEEMVLVVLEYRARVDKNGTANGKKNRKFVEQSFVFK